MATLRELTDTQKAYLAGIVDGEGCIQLVRSGQIYQLRLVIKTTSKLLADRIAEWTGLGAARIKKQDDPRTKTTKTKRMPCYVWRVFTNQAVEVLEVIKPYVVIKCQQVHDAIEYQGKSIDERRERGSEYVERLKASGLREQSKEYFASQQTVPLTVTPGSELPAVM